MTSARISRVWGTILLTITIFSLSVPAYAKYSGGTGEPNDPYQIATAEDLMLLGESPEDYYKHFILTADIDLAPNLPGRKVFDKAVIAPDADYTEYGFQGTPFSGVFDGKTHVVYHLTITGVGYLGLFGQLQPGAKVKNLALADVRISGWIDHVGGLVGKSLGDVTDCSCNGTISGDYYVGGIIGSNGDWLTKVGGTVTDCYSNGSVSGERHIGGLIGENYAGDVIQCFSTGSVSGDQEIGGLIGIKSAGDVIQCFSTGSVSGGWTVGGLIGSNRLGTVTTCYSTGSVSGDGIVGGLIGHNSSGDVIQCFSTGSVSGTGYGLGVDFGGLIGSSDGTVTTCYSTGSVSGNWTVGGLIGFNDWGTVATCYSTGSVSGDGTVGGLLGSNGNYGIVTNCYSVGVVRGETEVGGLVGSYTESWSFFPPDNDPSFDPEWGVQYVKNCFWDIQISGQTTSVGGTGKNTVEMQMASTFLNAGWDFEGETANGTEDMWKIAEGLGYPRLAWEKYSGGSGDPNNPYQIATAEDLILLGETPEDYDKHFILTADIDLDPNLPGRKVFDKAVIAPDINDANWEFDGIPFTGVFDGNGQTILRLTTKGVDYVGLFGYLECNTEVRNLGFVDVNVIGSGSFVGSLAGRNSGYVNRCYSSGTIIGGAEIGGLIGENAGIVSDSYTANSVSGNSCVGGLVGMNGSVRMIYIEVGYDYLEESGTISNCYSTGYTTAVSIYGGGLVGYNACGSLSRCYSIGTISGDQDIGGLVGLNDDAISQCFWDTQTSGQITSAGGTGKTTAEMKTASTFLKAGWDFVGETANGTEDIWWILESQDYPKLWWELIPEN